MGLITLALALLSQRVVLAKRSRIPTGVEVEQTYIGVCTDLLWRTCLLIYGASRTCRRDSDYGHGRRTR